MLQPTQDDFQRHLLAGGECLRESRIDEACEEFEAALAVRPDDPKALGLLGLAHFRRNDFEKALPVYEKLVQLSPNDASYRLNLGLVYLKLGVAAKAIVELSCSRDLDPGQSRTVSYLGLAYARGGEYAKAYEAFLHAGESDLAQEMEQHLTAVERRDIVKRVAKAKSSRTEDSVIETMFGTQPVAESEPGEAHEVEAEQVEEISDEQVEEVSDEQVEEVSDEQVEEVSDEQVEEVSDEQVEGVSRAGEEVRVAGGSGSVNAVGDAAEDRSAVAETAAAEADGSGDGADLPVQRGGEADPDDETVAAQTHEAGAAADHTEGEVSPHIDELERATNAALERVESLVPGPDTRPGPAARAEREVDGEADTQVPETEPIAALAPEPSRTTRSEVSRLISIAGPSRVAESAATRTAVGHTAPVPLSAFATERLVRPEDGDHSIEISADGLLIVRVSNRILSRTDGVVVSAGTLGYEPVNRRVRGKSTGEILGGDTPLFAVTGNGYLVAAPGDGTFVAVMMTDDIFYLREDLVFAFDERVTWEGGHVPGSSGEIRVIQFRGEGAVALRTPSRLSSVKLAGERVLYVDRDVLAGWIGRVIPRLVHPVAGGASSTPFVECSGEGIVLLSTGTGLD